LWDALGGAEVASSVFVDPGGGAVDLEILEVERDFLAGVKTTQMKINVIS
jgi:hypothetical protein